MERLYQNISKRKSTRKFNMDSLDPSSMERVEQALQDIPQLFENLTVSFLLVKDGEHFMEKGTSILGAYTKVKSPHYLVVASKEASGFRQAAGYSMAHVLLTLNDLGIATCVTYPGVDLTTIQQFASLGEEEVPILFIAFGNPEDPLSLYPKPDYYKRRSYKDILLQGPVKRKYKFILEAARFAPSSFNTQPWRFAVDGHKIHLLRVKLGFIKSKLFSSLNKIDMGLALGFMVIALKSKEMKFRLVKDPVTYEGMEYMITIEMKD